VKDLFNMGWPIAIQSSVEIFSYSILTIMIGWLGKTALAAAQVTSQYALLMMMIPFALMQSSMIVVSHLRGEKHIEGIGKVFPLGMMVLGCCLIIILYFYIFQSDLLISVYIDPSHIEEFQLSKELLHISAFGIVFEFTRILLSGNLRGMGDVKGPMFISILFSWGLSVPLAYFLAFHLGLGAVGARLGFVISSFFSVMVLYQRYRRVFIKIKNML
jgi:MATE family multidrug resistance protein